MKRDKKSTNDGINFVILKEIGEVEIMKIGAEEIFKIINLGEEECQKS